MADNPRDLIGRRFPDGYYHHQAVVGELSGGFGYVDKWGGDQMVDGQFLPEWMQMRVASGQRLAIRCREPGHFVAFIKTDDGTLLLPFTRLEP